VLAGEGFLCLAVAASPAVARAVMLLDAPLVKAALREAQDPLLLVGSANVYDSRVPNGPNRVSCRASRHVITAQVAGHQYRGWIHIPKETT
jgi:CO dehydrogenase/acetyl-CoA synthase epsilon subunit